MNFHNIKKLVYISDSFIPSKKANSVHVVKMCQGFSRNGLDVILYGIESDDYKNFNRQNLNEHYGLDENYNICIIKKSGFLSSYKYALKIIKKLKNSRRDIDLIFSRGIAYSLIGIFLGRKTICETHSPYFSHRQMLYLYILKKSRYFLGIILITNAQKKIMIKKYPRLTKALKILVLPDGVDSNFLQNQIDIEEAKQKLEISHNKFVIGYSGHLYRGRGINLIIKLAKSMPDNLFLIMGGNDEDVLSYKNKLKKLKLNNIIFYGFINNSVLKNYLSACDIFLMPYQKNLEVAEGGNSTFEWMSPMKMFEYMAINRPIISSDFPVLREILDTNCAVFVKAESIDDWIKSVVDLKNDKKNRQDMSQIAFEKVKNLTWENRAKYLISYF